MNLPDDACRRPTAILDSDHPDVVAFARQTAGDGNAVDRAVRLYYGVRDGIWYDPYTPFYRPEDYRASVILKKKRGFCVPKAALLCALARAIGIPSRLSFATVRNHLATRQLIEFLGTDLFVFHGVTELYLEDQWVKATPAFNRELCARHRVEPLEFDGRSDSLFQPYNAEKRKFMEYIADHGTYSDVPVEDLLAAWREAYGEARVGHWIAELERSGGISARRFDREEIAKP